jgi:hypothetical protein
MDRAAHKSFHIVPSTRTIMIHLLNPMKNHLKSKLRGFPVTTVLNMLTCIATGALGYEVTTANFMMVTRSILHDRILDASPGMLVLTNLHITIRI